MATPTIVQSGYHTDQAAASSVSITAGSATNSANKVFVAAVMSNNTQNLSLTATSLSGGTWTMSGPFKDAGTNSDQVSYLWQGGGGASSFTLTGYSGTASIEFVEVNNFNAVSVSHGSCLSFADGTSGQVIYPVAQPTVTPSVSFMFCMMRNNPTTFGSMPAGVSLLQSGGGNNQFHTMFLLSIDPTASGTSVAIPFNDGTQIQGALPVYIQCNVNGTSTGGGSSGGSGGNTTGNSSSINPPSVGAVGSQSPYSSTSVGRLLLG